MRQRATFSSFTMQSLRPGMTTRSMALRSSQAPRTPEPMAEGESIPPSPPRQRLRLKRRAAPHLQAPTQQFLASVAAADVPIPSIEEPHVLDEEMIDTIYPTLSTYHDLDQMDLTAHSLRGRVFSPPKTPAPGAVPSLSPKRYPDWSIDSSISDVESSPEYESSRPSTARSTQTSSSLFSRFSFNSEDFSQCISPEIEQHDFSGLGSLNPNNATASRTRQPVSRSRKAPWTNQMNQHLWFTYLTYLQDPKVTPFRAGKSGIPPAGVCSRVARVARRSWKGSKHQQTSAAKSGSITPTADSYGAFIQWPHTCAATRGQLRELCKLNATSTSRTRQFLAHSPTPFGHTSTATFNRRSNPARSPSVFSSSDMVMSLAVSTAASMQPQGPLAQLTRSNVDNIAPMPAITLNDEAPPMVTPSTPPPVRHRLGSPFCAKSYGPSSSASLSAACDTALDSHRQNQTLGHRRSLRSPMRTTESKPGTQKRSFGPAMLEPRKSKRPSLDSDLWTEPSPKATTQSHPQGSMTSSDLPGPRTNLQEIFEASAQRAPGSTMNDPNTGVASAGLARLGSPFAGEQMSHSFPRRVLSGSGIGLGALRRPFATVQQTMDRPATPPRSSLATRLAYIDERLRDFRQRDRSRRRSQSP